MIVEQFLGKDHVRFGRAIVPISRGITCRSQGELGGSLDGFDVKPAAKFEPTSSNRDQLVKQPLL